MTMTENFDRFDYFNFDTSFLENKNLTSKTETPFFSWKYYNEKRHISIKAARQKPMLRQTEWEYKMDLPQRVGFCH